MNVCILMPTTIHVDNNCSLYKNNQLTSNNIRIKQYIDGIQQVRNLNPDIEIYISDNSNYLNKESELLNNWGNRISRFKLFKGMKGIISGIYKNKNQLKL